jgi:hypothetical protein
VIPRLATSVWVSALLRRADAAGIYATVLHKGDAEGGAVILVQRARDGCTTAWNRVAQADGPAWAIAAESNAGEANRVDEYLARQTRYDPDLWIVELVGEEIQRLVAELSQSR